MIRQGLDFHGTSTVHMYWDDRVSVWEVRVRPDEVYFYYCGDGSYPANTCARLIRDVPIADEQQLPIVEAVEDRAPQPPAQARRTSLAWSRAPLAPNKCANE